MTDRPKLLVDADVQRRRLSELLERLVSCFERPAIREAAGDAALSRVRRERDAVLTRLSEPFTLVVLGDFKRGKSSLINALVGAEVATVDVTPETVTVNCYVRGETGRIQAVLPNGTRAALAEGDLKHDRLVELLARLPARPTHLIVERPEAWLEGLRLVDTPGLGDLDPELARTVQRWLPEADAVLFVISALSPLSESERLFLKLGLASGELGKITFAVNRIDALPDPEDIDRVVSSIAGKLVGPFPGSGIFPVSAVEPQDPRFLALRRHLDEAVLVDRDLVKLDRAAVGTKRALERARQQLLRLDAALASDQQRADDQIREVTDEGSTLRQKVAEERARLVSDLGELGRQASIWMAGYLERLFSEVGSSLSRHPHERVRKHFPFFLSERIHEGLTACVEAHRGVIGARLLAVSPGGAGPGALTLGAELSGIAAVTTPGASWTLTDDLGLVLAHAPLFSVGATLYGLLQSTVGEKSKARAFQEHVASSLPELGRSLEEQVRSLYRSVAESVAAQYDQRWQEELGSVREALEAARAVRDRGSAASAEVRSALASALDGLDALAAEADAVRRDLDGISG